VGRLNSPRLKKVFSENHNYGFFNISKLDCFDSVKIAVEHIIFDVWIILYYMIILLLLDIPVLDSLIF